MSDSKINYKKKKCSQLFPLFFPSIIETVTSLRIKAVAIQIVEVTLHVNYLRKAW